MGQDKALIEVAGRPLAVRVAAALADAGAADVRAVGGDAAALAAHGLRTVPDRWPGAGPLGGIVTALDALVTGAPHAPHAPDASDAPGLVLVAACDLVAPSPATMAATVAALARTSGAAVAVPILAGRRAAELAAGERAIHRAVAAAGLQVADVVGLDPASLADADTPADLPGTGHPS
jgi:molybdenum cofactor guanylyltransferase